jgi:Zn-finger nucleic acid-binding protein
LAESETSVEMNCPNCGAPMRLEEDKDSFNCDYCKNNYFPEKNEDGVRVLGEPAALSCPLCAVPLVHAALSGCRIMYCTRCRGTLIKMGVFVELIQARRGHREGVAATPAPNPKDLQRRIICPQCHHAMDTHFYGGPGNVIIDACDRCDLNWLDAGEPMRILLAAGRMDATD